MNIVGAISLTPLLIQTTDALMKARFRKMSNVEFKGGYFTPVDDALEEVNFRDDFHSLLGVYLLLV